MGRVAVKGGVWKNTEDEVLKAAVMKYGKNQWGRIASLLHRKSAKQCKWRWFEWLDPSIKKTEWSREEEEKLLHLAKLMPTQWRSIAPMIGRTAAQCLEHYEKLLDQAQRADAGDAGETMDDPRRLKPGEIDPNPETKPARPDPVDMDEDEKEMLSEARARLANTQGKKAKRKARERQLEEARRLASLQKRRELRAAGIETQHRKKKRKRVIDYNEEIPFQKVAPLGFYDVEGEKRTDAETLRHFQKQLLRDLEGEKPAERGDRQRKEDRKKIKERVAKGLPPVPIRQLLSETDGHSRKRTRLDLPEPQVSNSELAEIVKVTQQASAIGGAGDDADGGGAGDAVTRALLSDYGAGAGAGATLASMAAATPFAAATPGGAGGSTRTPQVHRDVILEEARHLAALTNRESTLKGGATPINMTTAYGFDGVTPKRVAVQTPNVTLTGMTPMRAGAGGGSAGRGGETPMRDSLQINRNVGVVGERSLRAVRKALRMGLMALPKPLNDFEIVLPEEEMTGGKRGGDDDDDVSEAERKRRDAEVADAADVDEATLARKQALEAAERARRSQAVQRDLPRPLEINETTAPASLDGLEGVALADGLVKTEMLKMLRRDAVKFPVPGAERVTGDVAMESFGDEQMEEARALLQAEMEQVRREKENESGAGDDDCEEDARRLALLQEIVFVPAQRKYVRAAMVNKKDLLDAVRLDMTTLRGHMKTDAKQANKLEKKLTTLTLGYQERAKSISADVVDLADRLEQAAIELHCYGQLETLERAGVVSRTEDVTRRVQVQERREAELQARYRDLYYKVHPVTQ